MHPPAFPFPVDQTKAARGKIVYESKCASCHACGSPRTGQVTPIEVVATDRHWLDSFTKRALPEARIGIYDGTFAGCGLNSHQPGAGAGEQSSG